MNNHVIETLEQVTRSLEGQAKPMTYSGYPRPLSILEIKQKNLAPRQGLIPPLLYAHECLLIAGQAGAGKTWFALNLAFAMAYGGTYLKAKTSGKKTSVLYVDGEMQRHKLKERIEKLIHTYQEQTGLSPQDVSLDLLSHDFTLDSGMEFPSLIKAQGQEMIEKALEDQSIEVLVLDNVSCLFGIDENDMIEVNKINHWLKGLRKKVSIILIAHMGKDASKGARGSSKFSDLVDKVISLSKAKTASGKLAFYTRLDKDRDGDAGDWDNQLITWEGEDWHMDARQAANDNNNLSQRNTNIQADHAAGHSKKDLASQYHLTQRQISNILRDQSDQCG